jgi:hypothetical protein
MAQGGNHFGFWILDFGLAGCDDQKLDSEIQGGRIVNLKSKI